MLFRSKKEDYYVKMAIAWAISKYFVSYNKATIRYLLDNKLDCITHNKAIQKIIESSRVSDIDKIEISNLRRKN